MEFGLKISALTSVFVIFLVAFLSLSSAKKITEATIDNCEVCVTFLGKFIDSLEPDEKKDQGKVETAFRKMCKKAKKDDNRFCYYVGGTEDAATSIVGELTKPISWGVPADKVCMKLYRKDQQICELKYEKQIDLTNTDLKKLKVRELKQILSDWEDQCRGCTEKTDFIKRIEELMPVHAPEAHAKRQKKSEL